MSGVTFLRRRRLGRGSTNGMCAMAVANELCPMRVVRSWLNEEVSPEDWLVRWGCTAAVNHPGHRTLNSSQAIHWCADKTQSRLDMQDAGVIVPFSFSNRQFYEDGVDDMDWNSQYIVRPGRHAQGRELYVVDAANLVLTILDNDLLDGYSSLLINKVAEYRVFVIQGRAAWVARKTPADPSAIAWNVAQGGRFDNVRWGKWPLRVVEEAIRAVDACDYSLDFCGVDVMVDEDGTPFVLEVNSAPSQTSPYRQACVAKCLDHIVRNDSKQPYAVSDFSHWRGLIHPALIEEEED